jgi:hypothetical protein
LNGDNASSRNKSSLASEWKIRYQHRTGMALNLSDTTQNVLRMVEARSGIPVHVEADPGLPGTALAKVVMARAPLALHRVLYRPDSSAHPIT